MTSIGLSRRELLLASGAAAVTPTVRAEVPPHQNSNRLWYRQPAAIWEEALPLGNGRLGCMIFGRVAEERLQLNEDTLWAGSPYVPDNPEANAALPKVRQLIAQGRFKEATDLASAKMMAKPLSEMPYGTLGDLLLDFLDPEQPASYLRELDLETAIATTKFERRNGTVRREAFVSAPDQVAVVHLSGPPGALDFDLSYRGPREAKRAEAEYSGQATLLVEPHSSDWLQREDPSPSRRDVQISANGPQALLITGHNEEGPGSIPPGLRYAIGIKAVGDGKVSVLPSGLRFRGARSVTLLIAAATSYRSFADTSGNPEAIVHERTEAAAKKSYARLRADHIRSHQSLFGTMTLELGSTSFSDMPTDERIRTGSDDPALAALYLQFARYLMISSSRPGTQPATLQGIWNEGTNPPWGSKYTININTEMNYWPADPAGLGVCVQPLLRLIEDICVTGARTAKTMYRARGWVAHHNTDLWRATAPIDGPLWGLWPMGGAWLCNTVWDHWDYCRDHMLLERLYPVMKGASLFFLDTLIEDPKGRGLITSPSLSPEHEHPFGSSLCAGPAMDRQILRDLFDRTVDAGKRLGRDPELLAQFSATRARLAPDSIGKLGQLQEWLEDWDAEAPDQQHRHVSHLYAVYPSGQMNVRDTPKLINAAKISLDRRGDRSTGWGTAWRIALWARMGEGERAHRILLQLLGPARTYPNMFDAHPPFQIDGNFGGAAGILEMIVQSWGGDVRLLPALPKAWTRGRVRGVRARGGLILDMEWADGVVRQIMIKGRARKKVNLIAPNWKRSIALDSHGSFTMRG